MTPEEVKQRIWMRCTDCGDCKLWTGPVSAGGVPRMRLPGQKPENPRRALLRAMGVETKGKMATTSCESLLCLAEEHAVAWPRQKLQKRSTTRPKTVQTRMRLREVRQEMGVALDMDKAREMRASGMTAQEAAQMYGISSRHATRVLNNEYWKDYSHPFSGLMA
jgi:Fic family protein